MWALRVVFVDQQAAGNVAWMARSPSLEDLGWANVDVLLGVDCLPLLEWGRGKTAIMSLQVLLDLLNFTGRLSPGKSQT